LLRIYKFGHQRAAAEPIAQLMVNTAMSFNDPAQLRKKNYLVVPVSTATSRIRERSFGHSELLARKISLKLQADQANVLRRFGQARQLGAKRQDRLLQLDGSFAVRSSGKVSGRNILLIDDVVTTGGTLLAVTKVLRAAGARQVDALLFAKRL
jgi:ComF family protein